MWDGLAGDMCLNVNRTNLHTGGEKKRKKESRFTLSAVCFLRAPACRGGPLSICICEKKMRFGAAQYSDYEY